MSVFICFHLQCYLNILTSPMLDCSMMSMEAASMFPASAFMWTPLGAFRLMERVGDSSLRRNTAPTSADRIHGRHGRERYSRQVFEKFRSQHRNLH